MSRKKLVLLLTVGMIAAALLAMAVLFIIFANLIATPSQNRDPQTLLIAQVESERSQTGIYSIPVSWGVAANWRALD